MPKIKTGLLVQCAMRNARGASKGTKERASDLATFVAGFAWPGCSDVGECLRAKLLTLNLVSPLRLRLR